MFLSRPLCEPRPSFALWFAVVVICSVDIHAQSEGASSTQLFNIPAQPLYLALDEFARQTGFQVSIDSSILEGLNSRNVSGRLTPETALSELLYGSGINWVSSGHKTIVLFLNGNDQALMLPKMQVSGVIDFGENYSQPSSKTVKAYEAISRQPARDSADVLGGISGLSTSQSRQGPGLSVNIRGIQDFGRVNTMIDGVRQNFQRSGHGSNGAAYLDPQLLSSVEVTKGPSSGLGGAGVIGGAVNFRTVTVEDLLDEGETFGGRSSATSGNNAWHFSGHVASAWRASDRVSFVAALGRKHLGEFKKGDEGGNSDAYWEGVSQFTGQDLWSGLLKNRWSLSDQHLLEFSWVGLSSNFEEGSDTEANAEADSRNRVTNHTFSALHQWRPGASWLSLDSKLYFNRTQFEQYQHALEQEYGEFSVHYETNTAGLNIVNNSDVELPSLNGLLALSYGVELFRDWTRPEAETDGTGEASWFTGPTPEGERNVGSIFFDTKIACEKGLNLDAGLRYDFFSITGEGEMFVGNIDNPAGVRPATTSLFTQFEVNRHDSYLSPTLSASWWFSEVFQLYLKTAIGHRPPSITETLLWGAHVGNSFPFFPNPDLETERSQLNEVGFNLNKEFLEHPLAIRLKGAGFENRVENFIAQGQILGPASVGGSSMAVAYVNLQDQVTFRGYELQGELVYGRWFTEFNWTRTSVDLGGGGYDPFPLGSLSGYPPTNLGQANGGGINYILPPLHKGSLTLGANSFSEPLDVGFSARKEDHADRGGSSYSDLMTWIVYDTWLKWHFGKSLDLHLAVNNLRNRNYAEANGTSYWVAPGRTATASLKWRF